MNLMIRKAVKEDAKKIVPYLDQVCAETDNLTSGSEGIGFTVEQEEEFLTNMASDLNNVIMVGIVDSQIVSVGSLVHPKKERMKHVATLGITVLKAYWHQGIGKRMMQALLDYAQESSDIEVVYLDVRTNNTVAIKLYESLGFTKIGEFPYHMKINGKYASTDMMCKVIKTP